MRFLEYSQHYSTQKKTSEAVHKYTQTTLPNGGRMGVPSNAKGRAHGYSGKCQTAGTMDGRQCRRNDSV